MAIPNLDMISKIEKKLLNFFPKLENLLMAS